MMRRFGRALLALVVGALVVCLMALITNWLALGLKMPPELIWPSMFGGWTVMTLWPRQGGGKAGDPFGACPHADGCSHVDGFLCDPATCSTIHGEKVPAMRGFTAEEAKAHEQWVKDISEDLGPIYGGKEDGQRE